MRSLPLLVALTALTLSPACFIVAVEDGTTGAPLSDAYVFVKNCPTCPEDARYTGHDEAYPGMAYWDAYAGDVPVNAGVGAEAARVAVWKPGYALRQKYVKPNYQLNAQTDKYFQLTTIRLYPGWDSDGDRLVDAHETAIGTNPWVADTDDDGLDDGVEVDGRDWVDYAALGADPRRRDLFLELDYEEYVENGVVKTARPGPTVVAKLTQLFAGMPFANPDGSQGIALHIVFDDVLPKDADCTDYATTTDWDPLHKQTFRYGKLCLGGYGGQGLVATPGFTVTVDPPNADPNDDASEYEPFRQYAGIAHELGHNLGLFHGGNEAVNCKPNYPSLMNYAYSYNVDGTALRIDQTTIRFSNGRFLAYPLDEHALLETASFSGVASAELGFLVVYGFLVQGGAVDWNRNGVLETTPVAANIQTWNPGCGDTLEVLRDHDDIALIGANLAGTIPAWKYSYQIGGPTEVICPGP